MTPVPTPPSAAERRARLRELHAGPALLLMPNAWDVGSARLLAASGFAALATTSSGLGLSLGRPDQSVTRDEVVAHVAAVTAAIDVPLSVDSERLYARDLAGVARTVRLLREAGAAGLSIEAYDPERRAVDDVGPAAERVAAAAEEAHRGDPMVLTARADGHMYGAPHIDDTIERLRAYRAAGADVLYAPWLTDSADIAAVVAAVDAPVNVLAVPGGPTVPELERLGVRRVSTGGMLASAAYQAAVAAASELRTTGTFGYVRAGLDPAFRDAALAPRADS